MFGGFSLAGVLVLDDSAEARAGDADEAGGFVSVTCTRVC